MATVKQSDPLATMLADKSFARILPEYLGVLAAAGASVPEEHLPALLELGAQKKELRPLIAGAAGERGAWLAGQNPAWRYLLVWTALETLRWEDENAVVRAEWLQRLRAEDPARALALLQSTWAKEAGKDKAALLRTLRTGVSMHDEPFLETVLDDKRKDAREVAVDLLSCIPESRLVARMLAHLEPLLIYHPADASPAWLEVKLPETCDPAMVRDGVDEKDKPAWWLWQMVDRVPPMLWCQRWGETPQGILLLVKQTERADELNLCLCKSLIWNRDEGWAQVVYPQIYELLGGQYEIITYPEKIADILPGSCQESTVIEVIRQGPNRGAPGRLYQLLEVMPSPVSRAVTAVACEWIAFQIDQKTIYDQTAEFSDIGKLFNTMLRGLSLSAHPDYLAELCRLVQQAKQDCVQGPYKYAGDWTKKLTYPEARLTFRRDMYASVHG